MIDSAPASRSATARGSVEDALGDRFAATRGLSCELARPLSDADATIQPMPDASPAKWHLAHTTWFFETFVLRDYVAGYRLHDERWAYLFNSYYETEGARHARARRGMLSRPSLQEVLAYRAAVDEQVLTVLSRLPQPARELIELGINHEQQHQELLLMDIQATLDANPLKPAMWPRKPSCVGEPPPSAEPEGVSSGGWRWMEGQAGIVEIGDAGAGFAFDCEAPRHPVLLHRHALADRLVTNADWLGFIEDGGYSRPDLWLSDGWAWVQVERIAAPLYWREDSLWRRFGLVIADVADPAAGNQLDTAGPARPRGGGGLFGDVWQWTMSAFLPHPGFRPAAGAVGEYNGKFMSGQCVLKGASCATPRGHSRASYRNFFYPHQRWQFAGLRLAKDL